MDEAAGFARDDVPTTSCCGDVRDPRRLAHLGGVRAVQVR